MQKLGRKQKMIFSHTKKGGGEMLLQINYVQTLSCCHLNVLQGCAKQRGYRKQNIREKEKTLHWLDPFRSQKTCSPFWKREKNMEFDL